MIGDIKSVLNYTKPLIIQYFIFCILYYIQMQVVLQNDKQFES